MAETILVPVGLLVALVRLGVALHVLVPKARAAQDRRDYAAAERRGDDEQPDRTGGRPPP